MLNIHDAALAETLNQSTENNSAALSASPADQNKHIRQRKRKAGSSFNKSNNRSALKHQAATPQIHDSHDAYAIPASGDASLDVAKYLPSQQQAAYTPNIASRKDLKPENDSFGQEVANHTQEPFNINKMQTSNESGMFLPGIYSLNNI